ncbi:PXA domain-containing protein, partial [Coniochaeta ligniaria NRRL 30616]
RRGPRAGAPDPLSDRATASLIRRVLCPEQQLDKGRDTSTPIHDLLPPLTSRNDVDLQLYALIAIILREYVQKWYNKITPDETFVAETVQIIAHCTRALEQRLRKVDLESLLFDEIPDLVDKHVNTYRASHSQVARPPVHTDAREIYHSIWPLPALSPVPKTDAPSAITEQAENEAAYRQLLVQGVLALLLPTEDLENDCLTALVGQIFSELIIGNVVANRLAEPWLIWEGLIILSGLIRRRADDPSAQSSTRSSTNIQPTSAKRSFSIHGLFLTLLQWCFLAANLIRFTVTAVVSSRSIPPRIHPAGLLDTHAEPVKVPVLAFRIWPASSNLIEMNLRMPWLGGTLSFLQWIAMTGPGQIADVDGVLDRYETFFWSPYFPTLSRAESRCHCPVTTHPDMAGCQPTQRHPITHHILDAATLPPLLRSIRGALFPNNAPGTSSLNPPSSDVELLALRRRCASALWALVPKALGNMYFGRSTAWPWAQYQRSEERILGEIETGVLDVFGDAYCNKHLVYGIVELVLVRLMPELAERGVIELWEERL